MLTIEPSGNLWGSERALIDLIGSSPELDLAVCCPDGTPLVAELRARGVRVFPYLLPDLHRGPRRRRLAAALGVLRAALAFRPGALHLNQAGCYRIALPAATLLNLPMFAHVRIFEDAGYLARQTPSPKRLAGVIAISDAVAAELDAHPALRPVPTHTIYDAYAEAPPPRGVERRPDRIVCVGRITPIKGQDVLLRALPLLEGAECWMAGTGEGPFMDELTSLPGAAQARWMGFVPEVMPILASASVLACPSHREPLGRVILEAWDAGCVPVVYAGSGGAAEIVRASGGGVLYDAQEPACLAAALGSVLAMTPAARAELAARGRAWSRRNCSPAAYGLAMAAVLGSRRGQESRGSARGRIPAEGRP